jgi:ELWxxDGT repeat protein
MKRTLLITLSVLMAGSTYAQPWAQLVKDACPGEMGHVSFPYVFNNKIYYLGYDEQHGNELWVSDGTTAGTKMLVDINTNGQEESNPINFTGGSNKLYFMARPQMGFHKFFATDGTAAGTVSPKDITVSDKPYVFNGDAYFTGTGKDSTHPGLWRSDGTETGTKELAAMNVSVFDRATTAGRLFLATTNLNNEQRLWVTDGTIAGTRQMYTDTQVFIGPVVVGNKVCLWAQDVANNTTGVYATDGAATQMLEATEVHSPFQYMNGELYYIVAAANAMMELHATNGTTARMVRPLSVSEPVYDRIYVLGNQLVFFVQQDIYISDGTAAGTWSIRIPDKLNTNVYPEVSDGKLFFATRASGSRSDLWVMDGTLTGMHRVDSAYYIANTFNVDSKQRTFKVANGKVYFEAKKQQYKNGLYLANGISQLYSSDGNSITPVTPAISIADAYYEYVLFNNDLYIAANDSISGVELWKITDFPTAVAALSSNTLQQLIYPNPTNNTFSIKTDNTNNTTVKVFSLTGQLLLETKQIQNIDIAQLPAGIYMVQIAADGKTQIQKLVKE